MAAAVTVAVVTLPAAAPAQQAILDTSRPFAPGAAEGERLLRGSTGWSTYQEGVADGLHFRFDPDGYAKFGPDARLGPDAWEVVCTPWPEPDCTGRRGVVVLTIAVDGHPEIQVAGASETARFRLEGATGDPLTLAEIAAPARRTEFVAAASLVPAEGGPALALDGLPTVARYIQWAETKGATGGREATSVTDAAQPASARTEQPSASSVMQGFPRPPLEPTLPPAAEPGSTSAPSAGVTDSSKPAPRMAMLASPERRGPFLPTFPVGKLDGTQRTFPAAAISRASINSALALEQANVLLPQPAGAPRNCPVPASLPAAAVLGDALDTLRGITGVHVFTDYLAEPGDLKGRLRPQIRQVAEERLRAAGIRVLSKKEVEQEPGKPRLEFNLTPGNTATGCAFRVSVGLRQEIVLARDPSTRLLSSTWSDGGISDNGLARGSEIETFTFYVNRFIDDLRTANSGEPRARRRPEEAQDLIPKSTLGEKLDKALGVSVAATMPLNSDEDEDSRESGASGRQGGEASSSPTLSTTLSLNWPGSGLFGRLTLYEYLISSRQQRWNPDFAYSFGYDGSLPGTFSLTYSNYGGNRFSPDRGEEFTRPEEGGIRLGYNVDVEDFLLAPMFTETMRVLRCEPAATTVPTYSDEESGNLHNFKTSLSFGCRYPIWRDALYAGFNAFIYPFPDQQQEWDPDFTYSFGWAKGQPGTFSLEYSNYSGNRWPWRADEGSGGLLEGAITFGYRLPLGGLIDRAGQRSLRPSLGSRPGDDRG